MPAGESGRASKEEICDVLNNPDEDAPRVCVKYWRAGLRCQWLTRLLGHKSGWARHIATPILTTHEPQSE